MKTLKWFWVAALLTIGFKLYGLLSSPDYTSSEMESFVGMILAFGVLTGAIIIFWILGRAKSAVSGKLAERRGTDQ